MLFAFQAFPLGQKMGQKINLFMSPLVDTLQTPSRWWQEFNLWFMERKRLQSENLQLKKMVQRQAAASQEIRALRAENTQLRNLLGLKDIPGYRWQTAKVLGRSPDKMSQRLMLLTQNKAQPDDVVASSEGLVGLVDTIRKQRAVVRTILDASLAVPVTLPGSGLAALVRGQGEGLQVEFVPWKNAPAVNQVLVTSGAGGVFPAGIAVAHITHVRKVPGSVFADIDAVPVAHWRRDAWLSVASLRKP